MKKTILILCLLCSFVWAKAQLSTHKVDWQEFLAQHDMLWDSIPANYYAGAILGNGLMGTNIYAEKERKVYRWDIGRSDVNENRKGGITLYHRARLIIGHFTLQPIGKVMSEEMRLTIHDAVANGKITTDKGHIAFNTYVDANQDVICIETDAAGKERDFNWNWHSAKATSPRIAFARTHGNGPDDYVNNPNPEVEITHRGKFNMAIQKLQSGYTYVTAWIEEKTGNKRRILVTVSYELSADGAIKTAEETLNRYTSLDKKLVWQQHKEWWHNYYPASFMTFPHAKIESFYWLQQYKFACLTRSDKQIIDLMGPWDYTTPWPGIWWNLNIQLTYSPLLAANRLELTEPLWRGLNNNLASLIENVPVEEWRTDAAAIGRSSSYNLISTLRKDLAEQNQYEVGNLTWALFYYWQYCLYKPDKKELLERFYPLLKRSIAYYSHIIYKGDDGKYHLPLTASPEYKPAEDCNYDLALLHWGLQTLLDINKDHTLNDPLKTHWTDILTNLVDYPVDAQQGFMIGKDVRLESSHRHYSHLLMIYPLHLVTPDTKENKELIERSLQHWIGMEGALQGYSYTGSSSIYSILGNGRSSVSSIVQLIDRYIQPNTLYKESGPVVETPLSAVASLQETYLQSWENMIRVFPSIPEDWQNASFVNLRTEGGFLISAIREKANTSLVQVESTAGGTCIVQTGMNLNSAKVKSLTKNKEVTHKVIDASNGTIEVSTSAGEVIQVLDATYNIPHTYYQLHKPEERNFFGQGKYRSTKK